MDFYVRPIRAEDAKAINEIRRMQGVMETILGMPSEREKSTEEFIAGLAPNSHLFVAVARKDNGSETVAGMVGLEVSTNPRLRHSGGIGIMVHRDYHHQGVGSRLMAAVLDLADNWLMLVRVELTVYADNRNAIALYEKFGFQSEGVKRMGSIRNGSYEDEFVMSRLRNLPQK